uniref:Uncharacterized protein n=1 Tax=Pseudobryopsis hainanensis TaxID=2320808 RepID=A0A3S7SZ58_9CHLO|nr:hypothetical protein [Pseudobryopsis hainanensis]
MAHISFYSKTVDFKNATGSPLGFKTVSTEHTFDTKVLSGDVALKGFDVVYDSGTYDAVSSTGAEVTNVQPVGQTISCDVSLKLTDGDDTDLNLDASSAEVLFIAYCE